MVTADIGTRIGRVRAVRTQLFEDGPPRGRPIDGDFERVALPAADCDALRDALIAEGARQVIEIGMAYGASALAIGEALLTTTGPEATHLIVDPFQATAYANVGWDALVAAGLSDRTRLLTEPSSVALPRLLADGLVADAAFVDGSHRFHEVFVDLYFLRKLVRPGGLVVLDDAEWPSVGTALRYYDRNLGWQAVGIPGRLVGRRLPDVPFEPIFSDFKPF
jgi:predicted O-methyltransferase YrrM